MEGTMAYQRIKREEQLLYLNNRQVLGVQSVRGNYGIPRSPLKHLGMGGISGIARGPQIGQFTIAGLVATEDQFLSWTGDSGFNAYVVRSATNTGENYSATSGFMTHYSSRCAVGQIPQYTVDVAVFGNLGRFLTSESTQVSSDLADIKNAVASPATLNVAGPGTITLSLNEFTTNRVMSYDLSIATPRSASYALGSRNPIQVTKIEPMEVQMRIAVEADTYVPRKMRDFPCTEVEQNLTLNIRNFNSSLNIMSFAFSGMKLEEESYSVEAEGNVAVNLMYRGYYM